MYIQPMVIAYGVIALIGLAALPVISYLVEALRSRPVPPQRLGWAPEIAVRWIEVNGSKLRYVVVGSGPPLVLLHTLRTQLDMFQKVIPALAGRFRVCALDYPGHGYSDIPDAEYTPELFVGAVAGFLDALDIADAVLVGESIGGTIGLLLAARQNHRIRGVVAINPYDYDKGRGLRRSSAVANLVFGLNNVPVLGATVMRLRSYPLQNHIFAGGVRRKGTFPPGFTRELYEVGNRRGHYAAFLSLVRHWPEWERAREEYGNIKLPVLLLYGDHDWSHEAERDAARRAVPGARLRTVAEGGHFLALDDPGEVVRSVLEFVDAIEGDSKETEKTTTGR